MTISDPTLRRIRVIVLLGSLVVLGYALWPTAARAEPTYACCGSQQDCDSGKTCCPAEMLGVPACNDAQPGMCMNKCVVIGDGGS